MARTVGIGHQDFEVLRKNNLFYVDKTDFIREWWENEDSVTLITRPRRFGKTLTMSMLEKFFSVNYAGRTDLFEGLSVWNHEKFHDLQGTYPVISLSFADVKETSFAQARKKICRIIKDLYEQHRFLLESCVLSENEKRDFADISVDMEDYEASYSLKALSGYLFRFYGKKVILLLDEYDTPMQEAYMYGYWEEFASFIRNLLNAALKSNPWLERAVMTGITRVSKESVFSDLNNLKVVTTTSNEYADAFGFTEREVFDAMDEFGLAGKDRVKDWYDGFTFGDAGAIYNPWSVINYLDSGKLAPYWADTSSNSLVSRLVREADAGVKELFESLLNGGTVITDIDEQIVYSRLDGSAEKLWSLLLASGYLRVKAHAGYEDAGVDGRPRYELALTNHEVAIMFEKIIREWFQAASGYGEFVRALLSGDLDAMNEYMNRVSEDVFSSFDTGGRSSGRTEPERFYHGFVLGLIVELKDRYAVISNRESGFGRYDVMLKPKDKGGDAIIIEFKVFNRRRDKSLADTVKAALRQIEEKHYAAGLSAEGIPAERIHKYGFAFEGKDVLIDGR